MGIVDHGREPLSTSYEPRSKTDRISIGWLMQFLRPLLVMYVTRMHSNYNSVDLRYWVERAVEGQCKPDMKCVISLANAMPFSWDHLYVFAQGNRIYTFEEVLGQKYPFADIVTSSIVFTKAGNIIFHADDYSYETPPSAGVAVMLRNNVYHMDFTPRNAKFNVTLVGDEGSRYYALSPWAGDLDVMDNNTKTDVQ